MSESAPSVHRVRMVSYGLPSQTTTRLFRSLESGFEERGIEVHREARALPPGLHRKLVSILAAQVRSLRQISKHEVLIFHTPLAVSALSIAVARLRRVPTVAFVWDIYPQSATHSGGGRGRFATAVYWALERSAFALATSLVVPSHDYVPPISRWKSKIREMPLWLCDPVTSIVRDPADEQRLCSEGILRVAFAGQINAIRSLKDGADALLQAWSGTVELHLFSSDESPPELMALSQRSDRLKVIHRGSLPAADLQLELRHLDVGWVCLDPEFSMPAFPSKSLAYIAAGLPVWFNGPPLPAYRRWLLDTGLGLCVDELDSPQTLSQIAASRSEFNALRESYLRQMESRWFNLEALL